MDFSIIVCCYNAVGRIEKTLEYLSKLNLNGLDCELLVVDNNSADGTADWVKELWDGLGSPYPLRVLFEGEAGVGYARKTGSLEAKGIFILFCDDDNWLEQEYVQKVHRVFLKQEEVGIVGGTGIAVSDVEIPFWFQDFEALYAVGIKCDVDDYVETLPAAGMAVRRSLLVDYYGLFINRFKSRNGKKYNGGEDTLLCLGIAWMGFSTYYQRDLTFYHFIPGKRLQESHLRELMAGIAESQVLIEGMRSIVHGISFKWFRRFVRDIQWTIKNLHYLRIRSKSIYFLVWFYYNRMFWKYYLINYNEVKLSRQLAFWKI